MAKRSAASAKTSVPHSVLAGSRQQDELFYAGLRRSVGAHAVLAIAMVLLSLSLSKPPAKFVQSIRVDIVGLPDLKKADLSKVAPDDMSDLNDKLTEAGKSAKDLLKKAKEAPVEKAPADDDAMALKKEKKKEKSRKESLKSAIDRIKALTAIENEVKKQRAQVKGNQVSKGNSMTGEIGTDTNEYVGRLASKLRDNWNLPVWLTRQKLNAKIVIFLDRAGYVSNTVVAQSSGNKQFDDFCLKTIRMSQPFGPAPDDVVEGGITLGFPL